jgi:hypothetical protein
MRSMSSPMSDPMFDAPAAGNPISGAPSMHVERDARSHVPRIPSRLFAAVLLCASAAVLPSTATAQALITCNMDFQMSGWSAFYTTASGTGTVTCDNGQTLAVRVKAKGGGLSVGKSSITNGAGRFGNVRNVRDVLGSYASVEAHAGTEKSAGAQAMTNGDVSLALSGTGEGWNLGVALTKFTIQAR